jgi:hypothetical protein
MTKLQDQTSQSEAASYFADGDAERLGLGLTLTYHSITICLPAQHLRDAEQSSTHLERNSHLVSTTTAATAQRSQMRQRQW